MNSVTFTPDRLAIIVLMSIFLASGCSSSSSDGSPSPVQSGQAGAAGDNTATDEPQHADDVGDSSVDDQADGSIEDSATGASTEPLSEPSSEPLTESESEPAPVVSDPATDEPTVANTIRVDFEITVPAYASKSLQVRLIWGSKDIEATWIGDQFWTITDVFPKDAELPLSVTFYDGNGDVTLARYENKFRTGTGDLEIYKITADQFDTNRWDEDGDGVSNSVELRAGLNALVNDTVDLETRELTRLPEELRLISAMSGNYEHMIPAERPYFLHTEIDTPLIYEPVVTDGISHVVTIDIDESGNGSVSDKYLRTETSNRQFRNRVATRSQTDNAITWQGTDYWLGSSAYRGEDVDFTITSEVIDEVTRTQEGIIHKEDIGTGEPHKDVSYALTGIVVDDSTWCEPVAGSMVYEGVFQLSTGTVDSLTTLSKEADDLYWTVRVTTHDGHILEEYLTLSVQITFFCDF